MEEKVSKKMGCLTMLVGLSGSGKSTIARDYFEMEYEVFSSDAIREEIWGDAADQQNPAKVFEILHKRIIRSLQEGKKVVYDATNLSAKRRKSFLKLLDNSNVSCLKECLVVITPVDECKKRDAARERTVGERVIERQLRQFEVPYYNEGWDWICIFNPVPAPIMNFKGTELDNHDNPHHSLTISDHMTATEKYVSEHGGDYLDIFAARYHDYGKYFTKSFKDKKGNDINFAHFYNHQNVGAYLFLTSFSTKFVYNVERLIVAFLIQHHMDHYLRDEKSMQRFYEEIGEEMAKRLKLLEEADRAAH